MQDNMQDTLQINGWQNGQRKESRVLEEEIQAAVARGDRQLEIQAAGQHGIGGRLWSAGQDQVRITVTGPPGQRLGSMGFANTRIQVLGNASDDVGWLNAGAEIVVQGHAGNGVANAMAQGRVSVAGNLGSRAMTMTKRNPRFDPPELWVLGSVGDYFAEFMAGGTAVICGHEPQNADNVLGYRACVGMVGGRIFFRGPAYGFSQADVQLKDLSQEDWQWLQENLELFLRRIQRPELFSQLARPEEWQLLQVKGPLQKSSGQRLSISEFRQSTWEAELGQGGLIGDLAKYERSQIPVITTGDLRRFVPVWVQDRYMPPCEAACPTGIPVRERWRLVRENKLQEAVDLALGYTPFPASVCGYLCPNLCMQSCSRQEKDLPPVDVSLLGQASLQAEVPELPETTGSRIAVIGGGPAGLSVAWQLRQKGHQAEVLDRSQDIGGKLKQVIPSSRIPEEVLEHELQRMREALPKVELDKDLSQEDLEDLKQEYDFIILAVGAQKPRLLSIPGMERAESALEFLRSSKSEQAEVGSRVVIIGAGNVGCDVATEAARLGAKEITLLDVQKPASFGKERQEAEAVGAKFRWPVFTQEINSDGVLLDSGELVPADTVLISVGEVPDLSFLPANVKQNRGFIEVDENFQTTDPQIFAIGDAVRPGLLTEAIGAGRRVARVLDQILRGERPRGDKKAVVDRQRIKLEYFDPRQMDLDSLQGCAQACASCGSCRECGICLAICPTGAISKQETSQEGFELKADPEKCIGCGFCASACPCGIWEMQDNEVLF
ncbi:MAG: FAD-dependent oxidoreductase [Desulfohalobiaceae bacterium]